MATATKPLSSHQVEQLIKALGEKDVDARRNAARELRGVDDKRAVEPLIKALGDEDAGVRSNAADALGKTRDRRAVGPLIKALGDNDAHVRGNAILSLGKIGAKEAVEPLIKALGDENFSISYNAMQALIEIGKAAAEKLAEALSDKNADARTRAALALAKFGDERAIKPLIEALTGADADERHTIEIVNALCQFKEKAVEALPALHEFASRHPVHRGPLKDAINDIVSHVDRPSGVRKVSKKPKDVTIERMLRWMASDVRQPRARVRA